MDPMQRAIVKYRKGKITLVGAAKLAHMDTYEFLHCLSEQHKEMVYARH